MNIWILFFIVMILGAIVQATLNSRFNKYSKVPIGNGMTGAEVAALTSGAAVKFNFAGHVCHVFNKETGINLEA